MLKVRLTAGLLLVGGFLLGYFFVFPASARPFSLGLDLAGGTELIYIADVSSLEQADKEDALDTLREVIERRVNLFGVSEPEVRLEKSGVWSGQSENRLVVRLPSITDTEEAKKMIGETPLLEFKLLVETPVPNTQSPNEASKAPVFFDTGLTGRYLQRAELTFGQQLNQPIVLLHFNTEGAELFEAITRDHVGDVLAIFLDGEPIQMPVINETIRGGTAQITGGYTPVEARNVVRSLNFGALPVPIHLDSTQVTGARLGEEVISAGLRAGIVGFLAVVLFLLAWYRLTGVVASFSLILYALIMLALFKVIPVTLTAAGIAGFILSLGMAVDANILIFERVKEELRERKNKADAIHEGFRRAWPSIRDANVSSIITAVILYWLGTSLVQGFALTFGIGVGVSMFTAIVASRSFLLATTKHHS